ncbi:hypothetical protein VD0002_g9883 [Verticillium dahliae]|uniref:CID domain-containing protein n=1 Tax=Verticillium dahliae TaxID=27337 RepID=A0AA45APM1_VERDA|nr:hypothetical protein BJF96_g2933 [Verticillium dahliae]PNH55589.1 hypothetical protein VD0002_g9883 [Verticillium dahliae]
MSSKKIAEFPNVEAKLQKPTKQSAFEKQRAEAEAKRAREAAETAAVLREFEASFDDDDDNGRDGHGGGGGGGGGRYGVSSQQGGPGRGLTGGGGGGFGGPPAASRRHFGASARKSGPGSLGPVPPKSGPGSLGFAPSSYGGGKKRGFDAYSRQERDGRLGFDARGEPLSVAKVFHHSDDEDDEGGHHKGGARAEEMAVARPTLRLSQIPPGTSPAFIKSLMPPSLTVEDVKMVPTSGSSTERKCTVAVVTLSQETPATEIDAAVSLLQNRYLGYGFYLSLHRHLSSAVSSVAAPTLTASSTGSQPFGAKPVAQQAGPGNGPSQQTHRGFAPPTSYNQMAGAAVNRNSILHVPVTPPHDVKTLQLINKTLESVLEHGPEFEALLMTRAEVQREEKWAWLWDARSVGGVWYRWRLWEIVTGSSSSSSKGRYLPLFDGSHAWKAPEKKLPFEYTTHIDEFISDSEYNSSDEEDMDGEANREANAGAEVENTFLNPLDKAKLTHLLSRLPTTLSRIRKGDIARITAFALTHASRGADEAVAMIAANINKPLALTAANPALSRDERDKSKQRDGSDQSDTEQDGKADKEKESQDTSGASLVGLYVVSDILSSSSTSGIRHAWRFRQHFEGALKDAKVFEKLGLMADKLRWGRLKADKWKRSVGMVLSLWEGWCVFPAESQAFFTNTFENPPSLKTQASTDEGLKKGKWKVVEASTLAGVDTLPEAVEKADDGDVEGEPMEEDDVAGEPMEDYDVAGEPMDDEDVAGEPMDEEDVEGEPMEDDVEGEPMEDDVDGEKRDTTALEASSQAGGNAQVIPAGSGPGRKRMRAVDMFAESGDSD